MMDQEKILSPQPIINNWQVIECSHCVLRKQVIPSHYHNTAQYLDVAIDSKEIFPAKRKHKEWCLKIKEEQ